MPRLIDAEKLKQHYAWWADGSREMTMDEAKKDFDVIIDLQPTADPYSHGEWEWHENACEWYCSNCKRFAYSAYLEVISGEYKYCPHCGAKMDKVEGDEAESGR